MEEKANGKVRKRKAVIQTLTDDIKSNFEQKYIFVLIIKPERSL